MTWGKSIVTSIMITILVWCALFYGYGNFILIDTVVPSMGWEIDWWIVWYLISGAISCVFGFICSMIWYGVGNSYDGRSSIGIKYAVIAIISLVLGLSVKFLAMPVALDGGGWSSEFVVIAGLVVFYLSSLFASPDAGKYIPPLSGLFH